MIRKKFFLILVMAMHFFVLIGKEYHVSKSGNDLHPGTQKFPFKTIGKASKLAVAGDMITVSAGVYRELVTPENGGATGSKRIVYRAAKGEQVIIKGSEIVKGWEPVSGGRGHWVASIPDSIFGDYNPYRDLIYGDWFFPNKPLHTGEVFINGKALEEHVSWNCQPGNGLIVITADFGSRNPNREEVEVTVRPSCFYPVKTGLNFITVQGFVMSQAACQWAAPTAEQVGLIGTNWSKGWIIEDCVISDAKCAGITLGKDRASGHNPWSADRSQDGAQLYNQVITRAIAAGWNKRNIGSHIIRRNKIFNCGAAGICGSLGAVYSKVLDNEIHDIYVRRNFYGAEMAGIKFHAAIDLEISGNSVRNCFIGLWLDWMAQGARVSDNVFAENDYVDFFPEVNHGPYLVKRNRFLSAFSLRDWSEGGVFTQNYFSGLISCAVQERATPVFKPHSTIMIAVMPIKGGGNRFYNNVFLRAVKQWPVRPKMHELDQEDKWIGYGLAAYHQAGLSLKTKMNTFLDQTDPNVDMKNQHN